MGDGGEVLMIEGPVEIQQTGKRGAFVINLPDNVELLRVDEDGDVYVRGKLVTNDIAIAHALSNASAGLVISRMAAWERLCEPCRSMLSCEDAARRLGKPVTVKCAHCEQALMSADVRTEGPDIILTCPRCVKVTRHRKYMQTAPDLDIVPLTCPELTIKGDP